ncbi:MAG: hypothetical protein CSA84_05565 [Actinomycetales bacterium]|nr:MAG: hypothetical protein CSA84_05565 [Actinomycetales bacterium]
MLRRKKTDEVTDHAAEPEHPDRPGAKNRPTPKRRDQEAANRHPLVVVDRKAARKAAREARRQDMVTSRQAMLTGDESKMPMKDRGPVRRYIRDYVDARFSLGEVLLPAMVVALVLSFVRQSWALLAVFIMVYGLVFVAIVDAVMMWRRLKKLLVGKFGAERIPRGSGMYAAMRVFQLRRTRLPRAVVKRGQWPS